MSVASEVDDREVRDAVQVIIDRLLDFDNQTRSRIFRTAETFFGLGGASIAAVPSGTASHVARAPSFSDRAELAPKDFLFQKQPRTDVERVACLAYYLTHFRDTRHFKTVDISLLNTEAAQVKFSNAAYAVAHAINAGLLASAGKGARQLSAMGERFVEALPDRIAAKEILASMRSRRRRRMARNSKGSRERTGKGDV